MKRDSRFELLRIISMFMIIIFHFDYFGQKWRVPSIHSFWDYTLLSSYLSLGKLGVYLFIMITGYFVGNKTFPISKSLLKSCSIWLEAFYYSVGIYIVLSLTKLTTFSFGQLIKCALPFMTDQYWFVDAYLILLLLIPFINICLNQLSRRQFFYLVIVMSFLSSALTPIKSVIFSTEIQFGYILPAYLIGAYIKKYNIRIAFIKSKIIIIYLFTIICAAGCYQTGKTNYINVFFFGIPQLLLATLIFIEVTQERSFVNRYVNSIAKTVFASYLITDNLLVKGLLWNLPVFHNNRISMFQINAFGIVFVLALLMACSLIDYFRILLFSHVNINNIFTKFLSKVRSNL
ncbi:acyltransferase family protein [Limosilactobacillus frumenti]|nr:acyltransferase family protein [Limosilactobacillus frumenti]